ncbi:MAG: DUF2752 domain-containing protein [Bacteroides sp.]|nr:DUF2752 domain-containing protein [Bacteroides sp.]
MYNPSDSVFFPKCPWLMLTGTECPSCGVQRFIHHLLNGRLLTAFHTNPFLTLALPYAALAVLGKWYNYKGIFNGVNRFVYHRITLYIYVFIFLFWWVYRNL